MRIFRKSVVKIQGPLKSHIKTNRHSFITSRSFLLRKRNVSHRCCRENQNTHFVVSNCFFRKSCCLWDAEKCCRAGQASDDNTAHAHRMLDTQGYKHTHSGCVVLIVFPPQEWLHECASILRHKYACLVHSENEWARYDQKCILVFV
jgi:hypothetical protein